MNFSFEKISKCIDDQEAEVIQLMKNLVAIKAIGPINNGDGEIGKSDYLMQYLQKIGFKDIENYPCADPNVSSGQRPNLVARIPGKNKNKTIWILSHMDVVPEGDIAKWDTDPFEAIVKDGKIYGRGTEDNHQGLVSSVIMAKSFLDLKAEPNANLALLFVSDEETGSEFGLNHIVEKHRGLFKKDDLFIVPDAGVPDASMIEVAEKSLLWIKFKVIGKQTHASEPGSGVNAFKASADLVVGLEELYEIFNGKNEVFDPPISTFEPTKRDINVPNINTIPGEDVFYMDCRVLPCYPLDAVIDEIKRICINFEKQFNVKISFTLEQKEQAAPSTSVDSAVVTALKTAIKEVYKIEAKAKGIGGGTVAAIFRRVGFESAVWSTIDDTAHQANEYCVISNLLNDAKVFAHICCMQ